MKLKKILCLLLALLMVCSMAACGEDADKGGNKNDGGNKNPQKDPTNPTTTVPPEDDTVWVLVRESYMGSGRYVTYIYDESGNLVGGELFNGMTKMGDYIYTTSKTATGGKIVLEQYKHVDDSEYKNRYEYEYDAGGRLIRTADYNDDKLSGWETLFTYDEAGRLVEQVDIQEGKQNKKLTFVYQNGYLTESHYEDKGGSYAHYYNTYDENGNLVKVEAKTDYMDEQHHIIDLVLDEGSGHYILKATDACSNIIGGRRLFTFTEEYKDGKPYQRYVKVGSWGVFSTGWLPFVAMGCLHSTNYFIDSLELYFEPLDVHLANQSEGK